MVAFGTRKEQAEPRLQGLEQSPGQSPGAWVPGASQEPRQAPGPGREDEARSAQGSHHYGVSKSWMQLSIHML